MSCLHTNGECILPLVWKSRESPSGHNIHKQQGFKGTYYRHYYHNQTWRGKNEIELKLFCAVIYHHNCLLNHHCYPLMKYLGFVCGALDLHQKCDGLLCFPAAIFFE